MINKLKSTGLNSKLLDWIISFLHGRQMQICVNDRVSQPRSISGGVPQGAALGPLLFLAYIDSIPSPQWMQNICWWSENVYLCKTFSKYHTSFSHCPSKKDINTLQATSASWCLKMNRRKYAVLYFARSHAKFLPQSTSLMDNRCIMYTLIVICQRVDSLTQGEWVTLPF